VETRVARWYIFKTKNPNLGTFFSVLQGKMLVKFMAIWSILLPFRIFCGHFGIFYPFWYVAPRKIWQPWWKLGQNNNKGVSHLTSRVARFFWTDYTKAGKKYTTLPLK
jgi:hypothetical protein